MKKQFLEGGKIVTTHGIKGEVKINPWCDDPHDFVNLDALYFENGNEKIEVIKARVHGNMVIVKLKGVDNPDEAQKLRGKTVYLNRCDLFLNEGQYFIADLIGLEVVDADDGHIYGKLSDVSSTGANDVYHITFPDNSEKLIPAIPQVIINTDVDGGKIKIRPLKGLFDDED